MDDADRAQNMTEVYEHAALNRPSFFQPIPGGRKWRECDDCGKPIPIARMKANPSATRCIKCQTIAEEELHDT
ncbi:MAG: TraR/DksA family transcriptional regulator [Deltaproteobacteria bacterium]|nr:TraR/DksA family transcriptional regulator [Deltaproteobacteria bacterium]